MLTNDDRARGLHADLDRMTDPRPRSFFTMRTTRGLSASLSRARAGSVLSSSVIDDDELVGRIGPRAQRPAVRADVVPLVEDRDDDRAARRVDRQGRTRAHSPRHDLRGSTGSPRRASPRGSSCTRRRGLGSPSSRPGSASHVVQERLVRGCSAEPASTRRGPCSRYRQLEHVGGDRRRGASRSRRVPRRGAPACRTIPSPDLRRRCSSAPGFLAPRMCSGSLSAHDLLLRKVRVRLPIASLMLPLGMSLSPSARRSPIPTQLNGRQIVNGSLYCSQAPFAKYSHASF